MFFIKGRSLVEDHPASRKRWMAEATEYTCQKFFPGSYKELQATLQEFGEYQTPMPVPCLDEDYEWEQQMPAAQVLFITIRRPDETWFHALLSVAALFVMNDDGKTIDRINA